MCSHVTFSSVPCQTCKKKNKILISSARKLGVGLQMDPWTSSFQSLV